MASTALPTGTRQRTAEELNRKKLDGGFRSNGVGIRYEQPRRHEIFNREGSREFGPSRADQAYNWATIDAKVWTSGSPIEDEQKLDKIGVILRNVLKADKDIRSARTSVSLAEMHTEMRLHQLMFVDQDYERRVVARPGSGPSVYVTNHLEKDYSVVIIQCRDWIKL
ncbi:ACT domain-containing family protein [Striga asiatica]|uniref:ACT domain-containing protein ACR n=1 Tax=Striga asiatica TaxID=4170 RepID=A0A5A7P245_STRAF|nr:ACT domain-containing family protein [Striga asiatica]